MVPQAAAAHAEVVRLVQQFWLQQRHTAGGRAAAAAAQLAPDLQTHGEPTSDSPCYLQPFS